MATKPHPPDLTGLDIDLDRTQFFGDVASTLAGALEETVGLVEASSFVGQVGDILGSRIGAEYRRETGGHPTTPEDLAQILVDLKQRIGGAFRVESVTEDEIVLVNSRCPFSRRVEGRPSLCMMTTNVFGRIVSDANGYARVTVHEAIATHHRQCRVSIKLREGQTDDGYEFFG